MVVPAGVTPETWRNSQVPNWSLAVVTVTSWRNSKDSCLTIINKYGKNTCCTYFFILFTWKEEPRKWKESNRNLELVSFLAILFHAFRLYIYLLLSFKFHSLYVWIYIIYLSGCSFLQKKLIKVKSIDFWKTYCLQVERILAGINFFRSSNEMIPTVTVTFNDAWESPYRFYLNRKAIVTMTLP